MDQSEREMNVMRAAKKLPRDIQPDRDLWPEIRAAITGTRIPLVHDRHKARVVAWRIAASVALVAFSSLTTLWVTRDTQIEGPVGTWDIETIVEEVVGPKFGNVYLGTEFAAARRELRESFEQNLQRLSPETRAAVVKNLKEIRDAVDEINAALEKDPGNTLLQNLLLAAYESELSVYDNVNRISRMELKRTEI